MKINTPSPIANAVASAAKLKPRWLNRTVLGIGLGMRTPVRKALLAAAVTRETYGRAFGFERMMDTLGAIIAPAAAWFLIRALHQNYSQLFAFTLIPGALAVSVIVFLVKEKE